MTMMNKFDSFNPLYKNTGQSNLAATIQTDSEKNKETKRNDRITREFQAKTSKEITEKIDDKMDLIANGLNTNMTKGFGEMTREISELIKVIKTQISTTSQLADATTKTKRQQPVEKQEDKQSEIQDKEEDNEIEKEMIEMMEKHEKKIDDEINEEKEMREMMEKFEKRIEEEIKDEKLRNILSMINEKITKIEQENKDLKEQIQSLHKKKQNITNKPMSYADKLKENEPKPALKLDEQGEIEDTHENQILQPLDFAKVVNTRKHLPPRPSLSQSTHEEVQSNLKQHHQITKNKIQENQTKIKKQQNITKTERDKKISDMMNKQSRTIGVAPITKSHAYKVCDQLTKQGKLKDTESFESRLHRTVKSLVKQWASKNLGRG